MKKEDAVKLREFIAKISKDGKEIPFTYEDYNTLFVKEKFHAFYLFFFLENKEELITLRDKAGELYQNIKRNESY